jgi:gliding motility-associated-like protein
VAATGTFNTSGQAAGVYTFELIASGGSCPEDRAVTTVEIVAAPTADAGPDQELTCNMGMVSIGSLTNNPPGLTYTWTVDNPEAMITDPNIPLIDVSSPGIYTLTVANAAGCTSSDEVIVRSAVDVPVASVSISEVSCFQAADGAIVIDQVSGGQPPYSFSLNGGAPTTTTFFGGLSGDSYTLLITDANGCFTELDLTLIEPTEVSVLLTSSLEGDEVINLGESVTLRATYDPAIQVDTIIWQPDSVGIAGSNSVTVSPQESTTYTVTIRDINGCSDSDRLTVLVSKERNIFMPTAFSPDNDEVNDVLFVQGGNDVEEVKSFLIFNRWGESVFENYNFLANDPREGWDGRFRGQPLNAAVYVYFVEVEFTDGEVVLFKGDVMLMR